MFRCYVNLSRVCGFGGEGVAKSGGVAVSFGRLSYIPVEKF